MANNSVEHGDGREMPERESSSGTPRWVKASWTVIVVVIVVFTIVQFIGDGGHGPDRHGGGTDTMPARMTEDDGHTSPPGVDHGTEQP